MPRAYVALLGVMLLKNSAATRLTALRDRGMFEGFEDRRKRTSAAAVRQSEPTAQCGSGTVFDNRLNVPVASDGARFNVERHTHKIGRPRPSDGVTNYQVSNESLILAQNQRWRRA
jgi:hypothetical protein